MSTLSPSSPAVPILRFARPTKSLPRMLHFYQAALGLDLIASFDDHRSFDGRILAPPSSSGVPAPWHLEFTYDRNETDTPRDNDKGHSAEKAESCRAPTKDNLLVLYLKDRAEVEKRKARMQEHGYDPVSPVNPYWDDHGITFEDAEGWRVVLCWLDWTI